MASTEPPPRVASPTARSRLGAQEPDWGRLLHQTFGFERFRAGQREVIEALDKHKRALAVFPTGGGKSICYQLPALAYEGVTLVVSPLIALMKDQIDWLAGHGVAAARLDSTRGPEALREVGRQLEQGSLRLLYVAPERFANERFLGWLERLRIELFAIDEAHCISEWGHNFRPEYLKLSTLARTVNAKRILALTATATPAVARDIRAAFDIPDAASVVTGFYRQNLELRIEQLPDADRDNHLIARFKQLTPGSTIVYVTLQKTAERVAKRLREAGLPARAYHAGLDSSARNAVQDDWMASEEGIVVATIAFGMGIDKPNVRYVYHYNLPKGLESYCQEIGRAGRDGAPSIVELLACETDVPTLENFAYGDTPTGQALRGLVVELLERGSESVGQAFALNLSELGARHDLRPLVLRTALTYLELLGAFRQGTPFYAGYRLRPALPPRDIVARFSGEPATFLSALLGAAKRGRIWLSFDPEALAQQLAEPRERVVRTLEKLEEQGLGTLQASEVRHRFTCISDSLDPESLVAELSVRFQRREEQEIARIAQVLSLVRARTCLTNALVAHFGEERKTPCGHCSWCRDAGALSQQPLGPQLEPDAANTQPQPQLPRAVTSEAPELRELALAHTRALGDPRQLARFLCGLTSPATSRERLSRHARFGALAEQRFAHVLAFAHDVLSPNPTA